MSPRWCDASTEMSRRTTSSDRCSTTSPRRLEQPPDEAHRLLVPGPPRHRRLRGQPLPIPSHHQRPRPVHRRPLRALAAALLRCRRARLDGTERRSSADAGSQRGPSPQRSARRCDSIDRYAAGGRRQWSGLDPGGHPMSTTGATPSPTCTPVDRRGDPPCWEGLVKDHRDSDRHGQEDLRLHLGASRPSVLTVRQERV